MAHRYRHAVLAFCLVFLFRYSLCLSKSNRVERRPQRRHSQIQGIEGVTDGTERTVVILYHKQKHLLTSHLSDDLVQLSALKKGEPPRETVYDDIQSMNGYVGAAADNYQPLSFWQATGIRSKLHAIGRLDADTTGLLLLTNDGGLVHHVTNENAPSHGGESGAITKTYEALIMGHHDDDTLKQVRLGVDIGVKYGGMTKPVNDLCILGHPNHKSTLVSLTISEGRNRQVRRMFHAIQSGVMKLKRTKIGDHLALGDLREGQWRLLSDKEVEESLYWKPRHLENNPHRQHARKKVTRRGKTQTSNGNAKSRRRN